ncbi:MAG: hypothetical protein RJB66_2456 [Pseudomonadota bacterium]|jgi:pyruvate,water dikinase
MSPNLGFSVMDTIGTKAKALIEMQQLGLHAPPFFILDHSHFEEFLKRGGAPLTQEQKSVIINKLEALHEKRWTVLPSCSLESHSNPPVASLFQSFTHLSSADEVIAAIELCWRAACSESLQKYCERFNINPTSIKMAVIVQDYIEADVSGTLFTIPPETGNDREMLVEALRGPLPLNSPMNETTPSRYRISWFGPCTILSGEENDNVYLKQEELSLLRYAGHTLQAHFGRPQRIDFHFKGEELFLIQTQTIHNLQFNHAHGEWTTALFREGGIASSVVAPLSWSMYAQAFSKVLPEYLRKIKLIKEQDHLENSWLQVFYARPYWNLRALQDILKRDSFFNESLFHQDLAIHPPEISQTIDKPTSRSQFYRKYSPKRLFRSIKTSLAVNIEFKAQLNRSETFVKDFFKLEKKYLNTKWEELSRPDLAIELGRLFEDHYLVEAEYLRTVFNILGGKHEFMRFFEIYKEAYCQLEYIALIADLGFSRATQAAKELHQLAGFLKSDENIAALEDLLTKYPVITKQEIHLLPSDLARALNSFTKKYYYHSERDLDLRAPRWIENARFVCFTLKNLMTSINPDEVPKETSRTTEIFHKAVAHINEAHRRSWLSYLPFTQNIGLKKLDDLRRYIWLREELRDCSLRMYYFIRQAVLALAKRQKIAVDTTSWSRGLIFYSSPMDLIQLATGELINEDFLARAQQNRDYAHGFENFTHPPELGGRYRNQSTANELNALAPTIQGIGASSGQIRGRARVVTDLSQANDFKPGEILVARYTDPGWTPLFSLASGVVCESGGILSHTALVSREYGIPSVLNVAGATTFIKDGQEIALDGSGGEVYLDCE